MFDYLVLSHQFFTFFFLYIKVYNYTCSKSVKSLLESVNESICCFLCTSESPIFQLR